MKPLIALALVLWSSAGHATEYRLLDVDRLDFEYGRIVPTSRDPYLPDRTGQWREQIALQWNITMLEWGYWNNRVHTETTNPSGSVTSVGWQFELGAHITDYFDVYREHHSRHVMEAAPEHRFEGAHAQFPVEDIYGVRVHIYGRGT